MLITRPCLLNSSKFESEILAHGKKKGILLDQMYNVEKIEIPLKPISGGPSQRQIPKDFKLTLQTEYATKYLEKIGATPTSENIEYVINNLPIDDALVIPAWGRETLFIIPDRVNEVESTINELFSEDDKKVAGDEHTSDHVASPTARQSTSKSSVPKSLGRRSSQKLPPVTSMHPYGNMLQTNDNKYKPSHNHAARQFTERGKHIIYEHLSEFERPIFKQLLDPLDISEENILDQVKSFNLIIRDHLPKEILREQELEPIRNFLASQVCVRFFGLLAHFSYWNILLPFARRGLRALKEYNKSKAKSMMRKKSPSSNDLEGMHWSNRSIGSNSKEKVHFMSIPLVENDTDYDEENEEIAAKSMNDFRSTKLASFIDRKTFDPSKSERMVVIDGDSDSQSLQSIDSFRTIGSDQSLTPSEKELIYLQLEECLQEMRKSIGLNVVRQRRSHHALLSCSHLVVDNILLMTYIWLREVPSVIDEESNTNTNLQVELRRLMHRLMSDILDPNKAYSSTLLIPSMGEGGAAATSVANQMANSSRANRGKYYTTSASVRALFSGSGSSSIAGNEEIRKFLWLGSNNGSEHEVTQRAIGNILPGSPIRPMTQERASSSASIEHSHRLQSPPRWNASSSTRLNTTSYGIRAHTESTTKCIASPKANSKSPHGRQQMNLDFKHLFASSDKIHGTLRRSPTRVQVRQQKEEEDENMLELQLANTMSFTAQEVKALSTETKTQLMSLMVEKTKNFYTDKSSGHPPDAYRGNERLKLLSSEPMGNG